MNKVFFRLASVAVVSTVFYMAVNANQTEAPVLKETNLEVIKPAEFIQEIEEKYHDGYVVADRLNIRTEPFLDAEIVGELHFNDQIEYTEENTSWVKIQHNNEDAYVYKEYLIDETPEYKVFLIPETTGFKSYMDYRYITNTSSKQYQLQSLNAYTGDYGIRMVGDRYCVAVGSGISTSIGQYMDLILENGTIIPCIMGDAKADVDTDHTRIVTKLNNCVSEFIVDNDYLDSDAKYHGDMSACTIEWDSPVREIKLYNKNIFDEASK